jgi:tetratricopeptide (TPR) repeat protein
LLAASAPESLATTEAAASATAGAAAAVTTAITAPISTTTAITASATSEVTGPSPGTTPLAPDPGLVGDLVPPAAGDGVTRYVLPGVTHVWQKWNNCGPSTVLMALSAFGIQLDQLAVAAQLKPDREDTNVTPEELAGFARALGLSAVVRHDGNREIARALVRAGVPVVAEQWIDVEGRGEMGHYRVVVGYDDAAGEVIVNDSYYGANRRHAYDDFERMWRPFLGAYVVAYRPAQEALVRAAIGADWDDAPMWGRALADQEAWARAAPDDPWAHFALGEAREHVGDHAGSVAAFDRAIAIGLPFRAFWYQFGYYRALYGLGAYDRLIAHADVTIQSMHGENLEESHYWRGLALRQLGREDEARAEFETALRFNPLYTPATEALAGRGATGG